MIMASSSKRRAVFQDVKNRRMILLSRIQQKQQQRNLPPRILLFAMSFLWFVLSSSCDAFAFTNSHHGHFYQQQQHAHATTRYRHYAPSSSISSSWQNKRQHFVLSQLSSFSSSSSNNDDDSKKKQKQPKVPLKTRIQKTIKTLISYKDRIQSRFLALPRRAKRLVMIQVFCLTFIFGGMARTIYHKTAGNGGGFISASPPIEIPYSRFLDLVEQQKQQQQHQSSTSSTTTGGDVPVMDQVRIGTDRIVYRLYRRPDVVTAVATEEDAKTVADSAASTVTTPGTTTTTAAAAAAATMSVTAAASPPPPIVTLKKILPGIYYSGKTRAHTITDEQADAAVAAADTASISPRERALLQIQQMRQDSKINRNNQQRTAQRPIMIRAYTRKVSASPQLLDSLRDNDIPFSALIQPRQSVVTTSIRSVVVVFYFMILWRLYRTISGGGGGGGALGGKSDVPGKLAQTNNDLPLASFEDIQGVDMAKQEVMELVDTLRHPEKYKILGARAPTGLLLEGAPGTGKTMLARATAASAGVPLLYCSGSDFVEMYVGRGAARVRRLFERAEKLAPCLIFIDELDALGKSRDATLGGLGMSRSNDEQEQTLNQLLACMDGLDTSRRICVMAATNRKEVLDPALIRPGRFDRIVRLELPNRKGRENILRVHCQKLPGFTEGTGVDPNRLNALGTGRVVDLSAIAAVTEGFSGAELEFLVNEAAIRAVRRVSAALRNTNNSGVKAGDVITPHVEASDFEASLANFYQTRRTSTGLVPDLFKNMFKT